MSPVVTLYGRPECHLCDEARGELLALRGGEAGEFELVEGVIDAGGVLLAAYLERIPVVAVDGEIVSELTFDRTALLARMDTLRG
jgi:hypothetical protein